MIGKKIHKPVTDSEDYTATALWCNANKALIEDRGNCYEVVALPEQTLEEAKAAKLAELNAAFTTASETAHCLSSAGFEINADDTAARNILNLIIAIETTGQETVHFCSYDNVFHEIGLAELKAMQLEIIINAQSIYQRKWLLREQINAVETVEELDAIVITFGEVVDEE